MLHSAVISIARDHNGFRGPTELTVIYPRKFVTGVPDFVVFILLLLLLLLSSSSSSSPVFVVVVIVRTGYSTFTYNTCQGVYR